MRQKTIKDVLARRMGPVRWIRAKLLEIKLRRRWKNDPAWRSRVRRAVSESNVNRRLKHDLKRK